MRNSRRRRTNLTASRCLIFRHYRQGRVRHVACEANGSATLRWRMPLNDLPQVKLEARERKVLDLVAGYQLARGRPTPVNEVRLTYAEFEDLATEAIEVLVAKACLDRGREASGDVLRLTPTGLRTSTSGRAWDAARFAERLLDFLKNRFEREGPAFTHYTWDELKAAQPPVAVGDDVFPLAVSVIQILRLSGGNDRVGGARPNARWSVPDMAEATLVADVRGLYVRAERLQRLHA